MAALSLKPMPLDGFASLFVGVAVFVVGVGDSCSGVFAMAHPLTQNCDQKGAQRCVPL